MSNLEKKAYFHAINDMISLNELKLKMFKLDYSIPPPYNWRKEK